MDELIDIVDTINIIVGKEMKSVAHKNGLWHRTASFLVVDVDTKRVVFQNKSKSHTHEVDKEDFFVKLNGGHLRAGEGIQDCVRELKEELGLEVKYEEMIPVGINQTAIDISEDYLLREFTYYFIVPVSNLKEKLVFTDDEVDSVIWVDPYESIEMILGRRSETVAEVYDIKSSSSMVLTASNFRNFTDDNLYLRLFLVVKRYLDGEAKEYLLV